MPACVLDRRPKAEGKGKVEDDTKGKGKSENTGDGHVDLTGDDHADLADKGPKGKGKDKSKNTGKGYDDAKDPKSKRRGRKRQSKEKKFEPFFFHCTEEDFANLCPNCGQIWASPDCPADVLADLRVLMRERICGEPAASNFIKYSL